MYVYFTASYLSSQLVAIIRTHADVVAGVGRLTALYVCACVRVCMCVYVTWQVDRSWSPILFEIKRSNVKVGVSLHSSQCQYLYLITAARLHVTSRWLSVVGCGLHSRPAHPASRRAIMLPTSQLIPNASQ